MMSTIALISSSLPSLDPNGQPYSMILRGEAAELRELETALSSNPNTRKQLLDELQTADGEDDFADAEEEEEEKAIQDSDRVQNGCSSDATSAVCNSQLQESKKRIRDGDDDNEEDLEYESSEQQEEQLLCYIPSIQCTCSSWDMKNIPGELFVTSIRVLFLAQSDKSQNDDTSYNQCNDVAIDGRYIALHAMDSEPTSSENDNETVSHIYCQLSDPSAEDDNNNNAMGFQSAISMVAPTNNNIAEEDEHAGGEEEQMDEEDNSSGEDGGGTVEVYFRPLKSESEDNPENSCHTLFEALSQLASSINASESCDANGGGLFSMLSMMAGMSGSGFGNEMIVAGEESEDDDDDDDMIIRFGGGNNLVENDDDDSSEGAADEERAAMLQRLDDILVVPPELRISSDDEGGQFDDADEDDAIL